MFYGWRQRVCSAGSAPKKKAFRDAQCWSAAPHCFGRTAMRCRSAYARQVRRAVRQKCGTVMGPCEEGAVAQGSPVHSIFRRVK